MFGKVAAGNHSYVKRIANLCLQLHDVVPQGCTLGPCVFFQYILHLCSILGKHGIFVRPSVVVLKPFRSFLTRWALSYPFADIVRFLFCLFLLFVFFILNIECLSVSKLCLIILFS